MIALVWWMVASMALAALAAMWAALSWAVYIRETDARARRQEARREARRLAPIFWASERAGTRTERNVMRHLAAELMARGYERPDELAGDAVAEMLAERSN